MTIPDYQSLMLPVLVASSKGEVRIGAVVEELAHQLGLSTEERSELLPSGKQTLFGNRVHWAKTYLAQAGLVENTRRGHFKITPRGQQALAAQPSRIDNTFLSQFEEFQQFKKRARASQSGPPEAQAEAEERAFGSAAETPDEIMRRAHKQIDAALIVLQEFENASGAGFTLKTMSRLSVSPFQWRPHRSQLSLLCVRWYLEFTLSYRPLARLVKQQGWTVHHSSIFRWVQRYGPEWAARCRSFLKPTNRSYRVDETYIKVKGETRYLSRAVDSTGQTIDFLLTAKRDKSSAKRFFQRAWRDSANVLPRVINVDKNAAYPPAFQELQTEGILSRRCRLRQCKFLNNVIEQDHRTLKRRVKLAMGYGSFRTAWRTIQGIETMHMIRKGRVRRVAKGDVVAQVRFLHRLFGVAGEGNPVQKSGTRVFATLPAKAQSLL